MIGVGSGKKICPFAHRGQMQLNLGLLLKFKGLPSSHSPIGLKLPNIF